MTEKKFLEATVEESISKLLSSACFTKSSLEAMQYAQAAENAARTLMVLDEIDRMRAEGKTSYSVLTEPND